MIARSWTRGTAEARVIAPVSRRLTIVSAGWSPGTDGEVQGSVVYVSAKSLSDLDKYKTKLSGAIVILEEPNPVIPPDEVGHPPVQFPLQTPYTEPRTDVTSAKAFYETRTKFFEAQGGSCSPKRFRESVQSDADVQCLKRQLRARRDTDCLSLSRGLHPYLALTEAWRSPFAIGDHKRLFGSAKFSDCVGGLDRACTNGIWLQERRTTEPVLWRSWKLRGLYSSSSLRRKGRSGLSCFPVRSKVRLAPNCMYRSISKSFPKSPPSW